MVVQNVYLRSSSCSLCKLGPYIGRDIYDSRQNPLRVLDCGKPCQRCQSRPYPEVWFHAHCFDTLMDTLEPSQRPSPAVLEKFGSIMAGRYEARDRRRRDFTSVVGTLSSEYARRIMQPEFDHDLFLRFPTEIKLMIAEHIQPCWWMTVLDESRRLIDQLKNHPCRSTQLSLTRDVWVSKVTYRGVGYVARLSSSRPKATGCARVYHMKIPDIIDKIVLSLDSIGVSGIQFLDNNSTPKPDGSPWYEILEPKASTAKIKVRSNGLIVQELQLIADGSSLQNALLWSSPVTPKFHPWNIYKCLLKPRLDYLKLDDRIQGLLVCVSKKGDMAGIHGFSGVSAEFRNFTSRMHRRLGRSYKRWIYFPLNQGELVEAAWIRSVSNCPSRPALMLQTSLGRTITFGPRDPVPSYSPEYRSLVRIGDGPITGIFHNGLDPALTCITDMGVTCGDSSMSATPRLQPPDLRLEPPLAVPYYVDCWYMTRAFLNGLVRVEISRDLSQPHAPIVGMLLHYTDGHLEAIGQVRWEYASGEEISVPLYVEEGKDTREHSDYTYIKNIRGGESDPEQPPATGEWRLPTSGTIFWWSSRYIDKIVVR
ncbi:uncharacterized protein BO97DRAFT_394748 [Aspergillus homomorphus CBS 101889]|uniref:Uncharacterized protein n=1 Tax=Aspergillus homomorphus (strain CBS 101889) TaxID=1450537 RepID=A0A395HTS5_ASPHC|nr:hypothetical protein BO97DRAFT_394748 [Aspergillus homomorphus CBS 101889]RAL10228.1 hypothetical protein BO97DRAFT_394748 [Aspergillus homomorphus CBS 101889]